MSVTLLNPNTQPKFTYALPTPPVLNATAGGSYTIVANQVDNFFMGLTDPLSGEPLHSTVYSYQWLQPDGTLATGSLYGPTIVASSGVPIHVTWVNNLPPLNPTLLPIDNSIHKANPNDPFAIPIVTHLHGGHNQAISDGHPDAWFTQNNAETGPAYQTAVYTYDNTQQAATLIYHDHALGYTPQNVYSGLGGFYLIRDANLNKLFSKGVLPSGSNEIGMALQDHSFTSTGALYMPGRNLDDPIPQQQATVADMLPPGYTGPVPTALPEFFGDFNLVNGMAWPKLEVAKGEYLFHYTNVSDSRFYVLRMSDPHVKVTLVGTDGGLLKKAMIISDGVDANNDGLPDAGEDIILAPGDRIDLVVDFTNAQGDVVLQNTGPAYEPFKGLGALAAAAGVTNAVPGVDPIGDVMQFTLNSALTPFHSKLFSNTADLKPNGVLNPDFKELHEKSADVTRKVGLFETTDQFGRILPLLGTAENTVDINGHPVNAGALLWGDPTTETPLLGSTEVWQIFNYTADAHPIHLHEVQYQVLGRFLMSQTDINNDGVVDQLDYTAAADLNHDGLVNDIGAALPLRPEDTGWQDTAWVGPGEVLKIIEKFDLPGDYVWHCHILSHENNEMMRPLHVINTIDGTNHKDTLSGTADIDSITAGKGDDTVNGLGGDDRFVATNGDGNDLYDGGDGSDTLDLSLTGARTVVNLGDASDFTGSAISALQPVINILNKANTGGTFNTDSFAFSNQIGVDKLVSIENAIGTQQDDFIVGSATDNMLSGGAGNDNLDGRAGNDTIWGQAGNDGMWGGAGADTFLFYRDTVTNTVDTGHDIIHDFVAATDFLEIDKGMVTDVASFADATEFLAKHATQTDSDVTISFDPNNSVVLHDMTVLTLVAHQDHLLFV